MASRLADTLRARTQAADQLGAARAQFMSTPGATTDAWRASQDRATARTGLGLTSNQGWAGFDPMAFNATQAGAGVAPAVPATGPVTPAVPAPGAAAPGAAAPGGIPAAPVGAPPMLSGSMTEQQQETLNNVAGSVGVDMANRDFQQNQWLLQQQNQANRPDQITPWGTIKWSQDPATGQWTQRMELNEQQQAALDRQQAESARRAEVAGGRLEGIAGMGEMYDPTAQRDESESAYYAREAARFEPELAREEEALRTRLANQGITQGSAPFDQAMEQLRQSQGDVRERARQSSIMFGGEEARRAQDMDLRRRGAQFDEWGQLTGEDVDRIDPMSFNTAGRGQGADYFGAYQDWRGARDARRAAQDAEQAGMVSGLFDLGANFMTGGGYGAIKGLAGAAGGKP